ncbi:MAG: FliM/FliN family flagellar motor switch protein [Deltaproteobacteria bacterium]|nr:FliM/FliN family flagellar motor switch protein [Deltaproteobacteria bacterium]MBN2673064.1 FliM/FliN family flagellar motor switch protein [Deltaproteobacteria bacterium]
MEPILTQEELEAIYSAMKADSSSQKSVDDYILASDHAYNMRCLKVWTETAKTIAPLLESLLVKRLAIRGKLEIQDVRTIEDERDNSLLQSTSGITEVIPLAQTDPGSEYCVISLHGQKMLLGMERATALKYITRRTGIESESDATDKSELTILEKRLLKDFFIEVAGELEGALQQGVIELRLDDPEDFWVAREPRGTWINIQFVSSSNAEICIWLRGPAELFAPQTAIAPDSLQKQMYDAKIEMVMELGKLSLRAYELWNMHVGDVYPLGVAADEPLDVVVSGIYKLKGKPTISRGHVAFEIVDKKQITQVTQ